ncbi:transcriptional regulator [Microbacterium sp. HMWF026]|uniref:MarR family winged helix-turn-helix transcriptional regulator n=1 Tax=Microbacterium sp. HMWF026 TaxID=2056861 RepID=UPI000D35D9C4|nr:MarR family winged helix-turn-helix transcriptional regulator [Microbacterium sp. HMWF026]PTT23224.1 transcriptional regulator [Microbacterium sp. HMWF026]
MVDDIAHTAGSLAHQLGPLRRAVLRASRSAADLPDIPDAQIELMRALAAADNTPSDLADSLGLARSTVSNLISQLEREHLVERHLVAGDGRRTRVALTPLARARLRTFDESATRVLAEALRGLDPGDVAAITAALPALDRLQHRFVGG